MAPGTGHFQKVRCQRAWPWVVAGCLEMAGHVEFLPLPTALFESIVEELCEIPEGAVKSKRDGNTHACGKKLGATPRISRPCCTRRGGWVWARRNWNVSPSSVVAIITTMATRCAASLRFPN